MDRFYSKINKNSGLFCADGTECWTWTASLNRKGYGQFKLYDNGGGKQKLVQAHKMAWILAFGDVPTKICVCHKCDHPSCVRPSHLFLGTLKDNSQDMAQKGRAGMAAAKLDVATVVTIRNEYADGLSSNKISHKYSIPKSTTLSVLNGKTWKHAGGPIKDRGPKYWSNRYATGRIGG